MSTTRYAQTMNILKRCMRSRSWTYARLADHIGLSESGVKKVFNADDGSFERIAAICGALGLSLDEVLAMGDEPSAPWRLTEEQEDLFVSHPECWWFLKALKGAAWDAHQASERLQLAPEAVEVMLTRLERRGILHRTAAGSVVPDDAARQPWQSGPRHGDAVVRPVQDWLLAHARERIRRGDDTPVPKATECGFASLSLRAESVLDFKAALRQCVREFSSRARRESVLCSPDDLVTVGVLTAMAPYDPDALTAHLGGGGSA